MGNARVLDDQQIRVNGIKALNDELGMAGAYRFLALINREPTDYVEISKRLYEGQTIDQIFDRAKKRARKKRKR